MMHTPSGGPLSPPPSPMPGRGDSGPRDGRVPHSPFGLLFGTSLHQQAILFRQMATMIDGGLTSARAVHTLSQHARGHFGAALKYMAHRLIEGDALHKTMALYPEYFSELVVCLVQAGEKGGQLDVRLNEIADFLEASYEIRQRVISQSIYPLLILHVAILVPPLAALIVNGAKAYAMTVLPRLAALYGIFLVLMVVGRAMSLPSGLRVAMDSVVLCVPLLGSIVRNGALMRSLRALGDLLEAGVPTGQAVEVSSRASGNAAISSRLLGMVPGLNSGQPLSTTLAQTRAVPPMVMQMIVIGEQSGTIGASISKSAALLKIDFDNATKRMAAVAPALLMLVVAGLAGWQYISFFQSYFNQINEIAPH